MPEEVESGVTYMFVAADVQNIDRIIIWPACMEI